MKINLIGGGFTHAYSSTWWKRAQNVEWVKDGSANISCYVDYAILDGLKDTSDKVKFAWWHESPSIIDLKPSILQQYSLLCEKYEMIFTYDVQLVKLNPKKFKLIHPNGIIPDEIKIFPKKKLVSMITSNKNWTLLHKRRLDIVKKYEGQFDLYGKGFNEIENKSDGLNDYMFSITVENSIFDDYYSEKILDCFATGTIPVYLGTKNIGKYFDDNGIVKIGDDFDIKLLTPELYYSKMESIQKNFEAVKEYEIPEDMLYKKYLNQYE